MHKFIKFPGFRDKTVTLSYDDGVHQDKRLIEIMKKNGLKGTFNVNSGCAEMNINDSQLNNQELLDLFKDSGMEIAVHGYLHWPFDGVDTARAVKEIITDREKLEALFGRLIKGAAYPFGTYNDDVVEILRLSGIKYCRTVISTEHFELPKDWLRLPATCHHNNPRLMDLAKEFVEYVPRAQSWPGLKMFYLWGHSYEFDNNNNWDVIEKFAEYIGNREDIWYATNIEIYNYLEAANRLEFSVSGDVCYNPTSTPIYIKYFRRQLVVNPGETVRFMDYPENV